MKSNFELSHFNFELIRVAIVDDHQSVAEGYERLLNASGIAGVAGMAYTVSGCWELLSQTEIDVLLLDVSLRTDDGIDLCPQIKARYPGVNILILTSHTEPYHIRRALDSGVSGFILKHASADEIIEGVRTVASGKQFLCAEAKTLLRQRDPMTIRLSRREEELLRLIVAGKTTPEIADSMRLGVLTVKSYRKHLMLKMNAGNVAELVRMAVEKKMA